LAEESLLQARQEPAWYEELMRLRDLGRVSKTPRNQLEHYKPRSPLKGLLRSNIAAEMFDPPSLNWDQDKYLELQKDRGKNLERFLRWNFKEMKPGKTFTKANQWDIDVPYGSMQPEVKELPATLYHGSPKFKGDRFDLSKTNARDHGFYGEGIYLTSSPNMASNYSSPTSEMFYGGSGLTKQQVEEASPEVIPVYANIKNPLNMGDLKPSDFKKFAKAVREFRFSSNPKDYDTGGRWNRDKLALSFEKYADADFERFSMSEQLKNLLSVFEGATGFNRSELVKKAGYDSTIVGEGREVIIYDPRRVKSMFNQGTFNPLTGDLHTNLGFGSNYASRA